MPKVLVFAYYFPPLGMGGVQRTLKFVKYLTEFDWEPTVLTVGNIHYYAHDAALLSELPETVPVERVVAPEPLVVYQWLKRKGWLPQRSAPAPGQAKRRSQLLNWLFLPDNKVIWAWWATRTARRRFPADQFDLIFSTAPPFSQHKFALKLGQAWQVPVVTDFRDDWTEGEFDQYPTAWHRRRVEREELGVLRHADAVTSVAEPITRRLEQKVGAETGRFQTLPNGFDAADFEVTVAPPPEKLTFTYCGALTPDRDPTPFLEALAQLFSEQPDLRDQIRVVCVGAQLGLDIPARAAQLGIEPAVEWVAYQPHAESVKFLLRAHVLLLLITSGGERAKDVPTGKIYEYFAAAKPIFALAPPDGIAADLIRRYSVGVTCAPKDISQIKTEIQRCYTQFKRGELPQPDPQASTIFERKQLTRQLVTIFNSLTSKTL